ncbi:TSUP family transporter [Microbacterium gorillae]|uniref:TSUP family transporter n=1 Tax=Microbacterium gorillae TaxID=1231063 RepID=UPI00058F662A|nr:TSUP family transporter [Microbacterium gorillae]
MLGAEELTTGLLILILAAAFLAGWVDAVVGGGGLLQLPALMLIPGLAPAQILATNKLASIFGTTTSSITYFRRARPDLRTALPMAFVALCGSFGGAFVATILPASAFKPIVIVALVVVAVLTAARPKMGREAALRFTGKRHLGLAMVVGLVIGFYDGMIGPGTGTFLVIALVGLVGYDFLQASAKAKIVNWATNFGALLLFIPHGAVIWPLGLVLGVANVAGSYLGSRMAIARGTGFIRAAFLVIVAALIVKLGVDVWNENLAPLFAAT